MNDDGFILSVVSFAVGALMYTAGLLMVVMNDGKIDAHTKLLEEKVICEKSLPRDMECVFNVVRPDELLKKTDKE